MNMMFTPAALLDLLSQIDELSEYDVGVTETLDGKLQLQIGTSIYEIASEDATEVAVPEEVIQDVEEINQEAYTDLVDSGDFESSESEAESVQAGLLTTIVKSLLLGGAVKLIKKML